MKSFPLYWIKKEFGRTILLRLYTFRSENNLTEEPHTLRILTRLTLNTFMTEMRKRFSTTCCATASGFWTSFLEIEDVIVIENIIFKVIRGYKWNCLNTTPALHSSSQLYVELPEIDLFNMYVDNYVVLL